MNRKFILCCLSAIPFLSQAQPILTNNEFYHIGDVNKMIVCDTTGMLADSSGAGVTWNYSGLVPSGAPYIMTVQADTSSISTANVMINVPGNIIQYIHETNSDSYVEGIDNTLTGARTYYYNYGIARRPVAYMDTYTDSFTVSVPETTTYSHAWVRVTADAYGTLILPDTTYAHVMRIHKYQYEIDTTGIAYVLHITNSYLWFDTSHAAPLLRIDIGSSDVGSFASIMYLDNNMAAGLNNIDKIAGNFTGNFTDNYLNINGTFTFGNQYELRLYTTTGRTVLSTDFTPTGSLQQFDLGASIPPGLYVAYLEQKGNPATRSIIKLIKQ